MGEQHLNPLALMPRLLEGWGAGPANDKRVVLALELIVHTLAGKCFDDESRPPRSCEKTFVPPSLCAPQASCRLKG
jgi:hypothetical protein